MSETERTAALRAALSEVLTTVIRHMQRGERSAYRSASEPLGVRGGMIETRIGDLCDVRDDVERIVSVALAKDRRIAEEGSA